MRALRDRPRRWPVLLRAVLLVVLLAGVVGMHGGGTPWGHASHGAHVAPAAADDHHAAVPQGHGVADGRDPAPAPGPGPLHDTLVGCVLALVGAGAALALARAVGPGRSGPLVVRRPVPRPAVAAPPVLPPAPLLHVLCVLRV